jgi:hypothetical protein
MEWQMANMASSGQQPAAPDGAETYPKSAATEAALILAEREYMRALFLQIHRQDYASQMAMGLGGGVL